MMQRVIGYIDGFNLYYGLKARNWRQFYWIDPYRLVDAILSPDHELKAVKYFTARIKGPDDKRDRQTAFLDAIRTVSQCETILGKYYLKGQRCFACGKEWQRPEEKMTDSAIASHLVADAFMDKFDIAVLVGGDTDIVPAIKMVKRHFPKKQLWVWFPPARKNQAVSDVCHDEGAINGEHLQAAIMPSVVEAEPGIVVNCPDAWANAAHAAPKG